MSIGFITRDFSGTTHQSQFAEGSPAHINVGSAKDISLNIGRAEVQSYARHGSDLHIVLANGETLVLDNFFASNISGGRNLFLSSEGTFVEVVLEDKPDGMLFASYEALDVSGKWSAYDELVFLDVDRIEPVIAPLAAPLLGGLGAAGVAAAGVAGAALLVNDDSSSTSHSATVDDPDATHPVGGSTTDPVVITGTGSPGAEVTVNIGGESVTVLVRDDGTWEATFPTDSLPPDGSYDVTVQVINPDDSVIDLTGPTVIVDTTPPEAEVTAGTQSVGDIVNAEEQADGPVIRGTGEPGASIEVEINGTTHTTVVNDRGNWSVTFASSEIETGEYETAVRITTTDEYGNSSSYDDVLEVDTIAPPIDIDTVEGNDHINFIEASDGVRLTGTGEAGASITVEFQGVTRNTTVAEDGTWSVNYRAALIQQGTYESEITVTSTDLAGNSATSTHTVEVDTETRVTINTQVGDDHTVNAAEQAAGVTLTGLADPGASVEVTFGGVTHTVTADGDGNWSATFASTEITGGTYDGTVTAVATDPGGNTSSTTATLSVDTETTVALDDNQTGDGAISADEVSNGFSLTGSAEAGATVVVTMEGVSRTVTADENGRWSAEFSAGEIPEGEYDGSVTVEATDLVGNTTSATGTVRVDTTTTVTVDTPVSGDNVVNAVELSSGFDVTGTAEAGATVVVDLGGATRTVTAGADGTWSATFDSSDLAEGTYDAALSVTATDAYGNTASTTGTVEIDTTTSLGIDGNQSGGDNVISAAEAAAGVTLTGTAEAGANVDVTFQGVTRSVTAASDGTWSADFDASEITSGTYEATISATSTDGNGNTESTSGTIYIDTETQVTLDSGIADDGVITAAEAAAGISLTGTAEAGASVEVTFQGVTRTVTAASDGTWSADFGASEIAAGEYDAPISVTSTDAYGNTATTSGSVQVDTATTVTLDDNQSGDGIVNATEAAAGISLAGTAEAGATVEVTFQGATRTVTAAADGTWAANFAPSEITAGEYDADVSVTATDAYGNTASTTGTVRVDTETSVSLDATMARDGVINAEEAADGVTLTGSAEAGATVEVEFLGTTQTVTAAADGSWSADFDASTIPSGEYTADVNVTATDTAGNTATTSGSVQIDTETDVSIDSGLAGGDDIVNAAEALAGVTLTGNAEAGASVEVVVAGETRTTTAAADGTWSVTYEAGALAAGEYDTAVTVTATDPAGNTASASSALRVDTVAGTVALSPDPVELDDIINATERADGVEISGTATPGLTVTVGLGAATTQVVADVNGNWSTTFPASEIPEGLATLPITASIVDSAGNTASASDTVALDTAVDPLTLDTSSIEGDNVVNAIEHVDGVTLTGTVEIGSTVEVAVGGATRAAVVDAFGNWTATIPSVDLPTGTTSAAVQVRATDAAGNTATVDHTLDIDTEVDPFTVVANQTADDTINLAEMQAGIVLQGAVEPGSSVQITIDGVTRMATVDGSGNWTAEFEAGSLLGGERTANATIVATDAAGNSETLTESFEIDTLYDTPGVDSVTFSGANVGRIGTAGVTDSYMVNALENDGSVSEPSATISQHPVFGTEFTFDAPIPNGTDLVITSEDAAGNSSSSLLVLEDNATSATTMDHAGLSQFNIEELNLDYASDVSLTLTEADIKALSDNTDTVTIHGGSDDTINVAGAVSAGTRSVDGQSYNVYTIGDDGTTLVVDQDVNVII